VILLAGGTSRLGSVLIKRLVDRGLQVRVLTRDPARAQHLAEGPVSLVRGDVRDRSSLDAAAASVDVVVSAVHGFTDPAPDALAAIDRDGNANLVDAAARAGADFVLMSTVGAAADSPMELFRMKYAAEQAAAASGVPTTVVRATAFLEMWIEVLRQTAGRSGRPLVFGRGENPINFVSVADVAALLERAILDQRTRGQILEIGGPDTLTFNQLADAVQMQSGQPQATRHAPTPLLRLVANSIGRVKPQLGRQTRAAITMDRVDLTFNPRPIRERFPDIPSTTIAELLARSGEATSSPSRPKACRAQRRETKPSNSPTGQA
jgi:NADH dehydrogenase